MLTVFLAALLASPARAAEPPYPCRDIPGLGCYYLPRHLDEAEEVDLLIFIRGFWSEYRGSVPSELRTQAARGAFEQFDLNRLGRKRRIAILIVGSSDGTVTDDDVARLGRPFKTIILAAHSGGHRGLQSSIPNLKKIDRFIMLDDFYFEEELSRLIAERVEAGATCTGFLTTHNMERWRKRFEPRVRCPVDPYPDSEHNDAVRRCLDAYLDRATCL